MCGDLLKTPPDLLLIQMTSVCLGKGSILAEQSSPIEPLVINHCKSEWEEGAKCSDTTLQGYWANELGELAEEQGGFCPHSRPGDLWKGGLRYKKETPKDKKERLPNAVWLMGLHCSTRHAFGRGSALRRGRGWCLVFASFVLVTEPAPLSTAALQQGCLLMQGGVWLGTKGFAPASACLASVNGLNYLGSCCSYDLVHRHH